MLIIMMLCAFVYFVCGVLTTVMFVLCPDHVKGDCSEFCVDSQLD